MNKKDIMQINYHIKMLKKKIYQKVEYVHYLDCLVNNILLERVLNGSPSVGAYSMLLEIIFGIDGGGFLMPLLAIITRSQCISQRNCSVSLTLGTSLIILIY